MLDTSATTVASHPNASFWLDVADKIIKCLAVIIGGAWTWMNFIRGRTYAQKLDLQLNGNVFYKEDLYVDVTVLLKNLGAARHIVQPEGTSCEIVAIHKDLSRDRLRIFSMFLLHSQIEPGESISDHVLWRVEDPQADIVWLSFNLRVVSGEIEWNATYIVRVEERPTDRMQFE